MGHFGALGDLFGVTLGYFGGDFGATLGDFWSVWGDFGVTLEPLKAYEGDLVPPWCLLGTSLVPPRCLLAPLDLVPGPFLELLC